MDTRRPILVPTDLSEAAERALQFALAWAQEQQAPVVLLHVLDLFPSGVPSVVPEGLTDGTVWDELEQAYDRELQRLAERYQGSVPLTPIQRRDAAIVPAIVEAAREYDAALIVMGTHGRRGVSRLMLGSVAEEVVREAPCDVVVAHAASPTPPRLRRVVVPVDFSAGSVAVLELGKAFAAAHGGEVDLLHVFEEPALPVFWPGPGVVQDLIPKLKRQAMQELERLRERAGGPTANVQAILERGHPAATILDHCAAASADLIVMGSHGYTGVERFLLGSVTARVLREATCPVYVHRFTPDEEDVHAEAAATGAPETG